MVHKVPDGIRDEDVVLSSNIGNGYRFILKKAQLKPNQNVLICGPGAMGLATVITAKECGIYPIIVTGFGEKDAPRLELAKEYGADYTIRVDLEDAAAKIMEITHGKGVNAVIECSGAPSSYELAFKTMAPNATVVVVAATGKDGIKIDTNQMMSKEFQIKGSLGQPLDVFEAMKTINKAKYRIDKMVTHKFPMSKADEAIAFFMNNSSECIRVAICAEDTE